MSAPRETSLVAEDRAEIDCSERLPAILYTRIHSNYKRKNRRADGWREVARNDGKRRKGGGAAKWRGGGVRLTLPTIAADFYNKVSAK